MLRYTDDSTLPHTLYKGLDFFRACGIFFPATGTFFHEGILFAVVLGGVQHRGKIHVDSQFYQFAADVFSNQLYGVCRHVAHLFGAGGVFPFFGDAA